MEEGEERREGMKERSMRGGLGGGGREIKRGGGKKERGLQEEEELSERREWGRGK